MHSPVVDDAPGIIDFTSIGGACAAVNYTYNTLAGDLFMGNAGTGIVTSAYLAKNALTDPGSNSFYNL